MKLIDEKGRLFGIINIFDLFVLFIFAMSIFFAVQWGRMAKDPGWVDIKLFPVRCEAVLQVPGRPDTGVPPYLAEVVKEGDEVKDDAGLVIAKIEKIVSNNPVSAIVYSSKEGEKLLYNSDSREVTVILNLSAYEKKGTIYSCLGNVPLRIGDSLMLPTARYSVQVSIRKIL